MVRIWVSMVPDLGGLGVGQKRRGGNVLGMEHVRLFDAGMADTAACCCDQCDLAVESSFGFVRLSIKGW
jgi:hypothetical protein